VPNPPADPDDLYGLPLEEFTSARNALAKELARQGDKAASDRVKRLPKPSKTAWVLNQLARHRSGDVEALLEAGRRAREAQQRALEGDASQLRAATRAEQEQINALVDAALDLGGGDGAIADRIRRTLRAAATDDDTGWRLRRGCLVSDVEASGFGLEALEGLEDLAPVARAAQAPVGAPSRHREQDRAQRQALRQAKAEAERLRKEADVQQNRARRSMEDAERAQRRADEARRAAEEARGAAEEAQRQADEAAARVQALEGD
jgi:hypothetical protein